jgi:hypothetical protein
LNGESFLAKKKLFLELRLKGEIVERHVESFFFSRKAGMSLHHRVELLRRALWVFLQSGKPIFRLLQECRNAEYSRHRRFWERRMPDLRSPVMEKRLSAPVLNVPDALEQIRGQGLLLLMPFRIR